jgi:hypothetical protein
MIKTRISVILALATIAGASAACGELTPLENAQECPCASGYSCYSGVCIAGAVSIALGEASVPGAPDASALTTVQTVSGRAPGLLPQGSQTSFSYAESIWPTMYGWALNGWLINASVGDSFTFRLWAEDDAGAHPLSLVMYGPLEGLGTASCSAASIGNGPLAGTEIPWTAATTGTFFVAPYHDVVETSEGLAFGGLNDTDYATAYILMN